MPKLWNETIDAHREAVREAILDATAMLVAARGLRAIKMSGIAEAAGIGRATLYKYFPTVEAILLAWHERQIGSHLKHLADIRDQASDPRAQLESVLEAYALISQEHRRHHDAELSAFLHRDAQVDRARRLLRDLIRNILLECVETDAVRDDTAPDELAGYCLHALAAAGELRSKAAIQRLVALILGGLRRGA